MDFPSASDTRRKQQERSDQILQKQLNKILPNIDKSVEKDKNETVMYISKIVKD